MKPHDSSSPTKSESSSIQLTSDFKFFDLLTFKRQKECNIRIPSTVLIERGLIKEWLLNDIKQSQSSVCTSHPLLIKKHQNLSPLSVLKSLCSELGYHSIATECKSVIDLKISIVEAMKQEKNFEYIKDKKVIDILTTDQETLSMSLVQFLTFLSENKFADQMFYDQWRMIQKRVIDNKVQEQYSVRSAKNQHGNLQHKSQKMITVLNGFTGAISTELLNDSNNNHTDKSSPKKDPFIGSPSKTKFTVAQTKTMSGYKFFDTFLNKKFYQMSQQLIQFIQKNLKCVVESVSIRYMIDKKRQPYFMGISEMKISPILKIAITRDFIFMKEKGTIRFDEYIKPLGQYHAERVQQTRSFGNQNVKSKNRCQGDFCNCKPKQIPYFYIMEQKSKLPLVGNKLRTPTQLIQAVRKRVKRVIQRLKQYNQIQQSYEYNDGSSSEYSSDENDEQSTKDLKSCQNCYLFYLNVLRMFQLDSFGNLIEKKNPTIVKGFQDKQANQMDLRKPEDKQKHSEENPIKKSKISINPRQVNSLSELNLAKTKRNRFIAQPIISHNRSLIRLPTNSQVINSANKLSATPYSKKLKSRASEPKDFLKTKIKLEALNRQEHRYRGHSQKIVSQKSEQQKRINLEAISRISESLKSAQRTKPKTLKLAASRIPQSYLQGCEQLLQKLQRLPSSSWQQFIYYAKKYYLDNLPQPLSRYCHTSQPISNLYTFFNNSPIHLSLPYCIKQRPIMSLRRLSQLAQYPQIVSKSSFHFDILIVDEATTIPFCIITTKMLGNRDFQSKSYENIIIFNDLFDSFIEYINLAKGMIQQQSNKRVILFNRPGQSHTIYTQREAEGIKDLGDVIDKLIYRISGQKGQLGYVNIDKDRWKFVGFGYGGYLLSAYLGYYHFYFPKISGVLLINSFANINLKYKQLLRSLLQLYDSQDPTVPFQSFLFYNKAINSSQQSRNDMEYKSGLNSIRTPGRVYILKNALEQAVKFTITDGFETLNSCPVHVIYGVGNVFYNQSELQNLLVYQKNRQKKEIPLRKLIQCDGGFDLISDNYDQVEYRMSEFARMNDQM